MIAECWSSELCDLSLHIYEYLDERNVELKIKGALGLLIFSHYIILKHLTTFFSSSVTSHHTHTVTRRKETRLKKNTLSSIRARAQCRRWSSTAGPESLHWDLPVLSSSPEGLLTGTYWWRKKQILFPVNQVSLEMIWKCNGCTKTMFARMDFLQKLYRILISLVTVPTEMHG